MILNKDMMMSDEEITALNDTVKSLLDVWHARSSDDNAHAAFAIQTITEYFTLIELGNKCDLYRDQNGTYLIVRNETLFGSTKYTWTSQEYQERALGFDNNPLQWEQL